MNEVNLQLKLTSLLFTVSKFQIDKLARKGGKTVKRAVANMTNALLSNELQRCLNWTGRCNKNALRGLQCATAIQRKP